MNARVIWKLICPKIAFVLLLYYRIYLASVCLRAPTRPKAQLLLQPYYSIPTTPNLSLIPHGVLLLNYRAPQLPLLFHPLLPLRPTSQPWRNRRQRRERHIRRVRRRQPCCVRTLESCGWQEPIGAIAGPGFEVGCFCRCGGLGLVERGLVVELAEGEGVCWGGG